MISAKDRMKEKIKDAKKTLPKVDKTRIEGYTSKYRIKFDGVKYTIENRVLFFFWVNPLKYRDHQSLVMTPPSIRKYSWFKTEREAIEEYNNLISKTSKQRFKPTYKYV